VFACVTIEKPQFPKVSTISFCETCEKERTGTTKTHFSQCPVRPVRTNPPSCPVFTQTTSSTRLYPHKANSSLASSMARPVTHSARRPQVGCREGMGRRRRSSSVRSRYGSCGAGKSGRARLTRLWVKRNIRSYGCPKADLPRSVRT
jgi:hypothetical protein